MYKSGRSAPGFGAILHVMTPTEVPLTELAELYRDLHAHPELSFQETPTAGIVADRLAALSYRVHTGIGGTGVVGVLACGHDVHVTCLVGAVRALAADPTAWSGTVVAVFQPAEELGGGARAMVDDGLFERVPRPEVVLGQHVCPLPAGVLGVRPGPAFAASDSLRVTLHGRGGHGSRPETTVDPVVMAAAVVLRLQTVVSRELPATEVAVVTVGSIQAGSKNNIIPDDAELLLSVRTFDNDVRDRALAAIHRIVSAEAAAAGAPREPDIEILESFPSLVNSPDAADRVRTAFAARFGDEVVIDPGLVTGSEDVGVLATAADAACAYWLLGGAEPSLFGCADSAEEIAVRVRDLPSNHSPVYAPVIEPTLSRGVETMVTAARAWLPATG